MNRFKIVLITFFISLPSFGVSKKKFEELELFNKVLHLVNNQYYREVSTEKLIEGAIKGMLDTLDPHSSYLYKEIFQKMKTDTSGEYGGLGLEVTVKDGAIYVITAIEGTPAFKKGIRARDKIVEIDGDSTIGMTLAEAVNKMKGPSGKKINLGIQREGKEGITRFDITRRRIKIKPVKYELIAGEFGYIKLKQFQKNSGKEVNQALKALKRKSKGKLKGIILDLRSNPGGLLDEAVKVASVFLAEGVVVSTESRDPQQKEFKYVNKKIKKDLTTPMVTLINGASASASEIVAGALQDYKRSVIMGGNSFGKGSVQQVVPLNESSGIKLTIAQYMTPQGRKIQAKGIRPDISLPELDESWRDLNKEAEYLREKDLQGHLSATIETAEEAKVRKAREKKERLARIKKMKENKKSSKDVFRKYLPREDYQVVQAMNYMKGYRVFKDFYRKNTSR